MNIRTFNASWRLVAGSISLTVALGAFVTPAHAEPVGANVVAGEASINTNGNNTVIDVTTQNAIINYQSFNIGSNEYVQFNQLNATSAVLNRIDGSAPTSINGHLSANGIVYFVNPAGVTFGNGAVIDVAGIYAAAGNISNADFMSGTNRFTNLTGQVINQGTINSQFVALVGKRVVNDGIIFAPGGVVTMVAGDNVMLGQRDGTIMVKVESNPGAVKQAEGSEAGVENNGSINTGENGQVIMGAGDMYWLGVKQSDTGSIKAGSVVVDAGKSAAQISGSIDATSYSSTGGSIAVLGDEIALYDAYLDVSGVHGGGTINIGGSFQGNGPLSNASDVFVSSDTVLNANALTSGGGGTVIVWSDHYTGFYGSIVAVGANGGPGGFAEVSGKQTLGFDGFVNTGGGTLLLDPGTLTLVDADAGGSQDVNLPTIGSGDPDILGNTVSWGAVNTALQLGNVDLSATGLVTIGDINGGSLLSSGNTLTLTAGTNTLSLTSTTGGITFADTNDVLNFNGNSADFSAATSMTVGNITAGAISLTAGTDLTTGSLTTTSGAMTLNVGNNDAGSTNSIGTLTLATTGTITAGNGTNSITLANTPAGLTVNGGTGTDTLTGPNAVTTWSVTGANGGTVGSSAFTAIENLTGGTDNDTFTFQNGATVSGTVNGGAGGTNTLDLSPYLSDVSITLTGSAANGFTGTTAPVTGGFSNITAVTGGSGHSTLVGENATSTWTVTSPGGIGTYSDGSQTLNFTLFDRLTGGSGADTFSVNANFSGNLAGGNGTNIVNLASSTGVTGTYTGGSGNDTLNLASGSSVSGLVDLGSGGTNTLNYNASNFNAAVSIDFANSTATNLNSGFANVNAVVGDADFAATNTLYGPNTANTWNITTAAGGNINSTTNFTNFTQLNGGTNNDDFVFGNAGSAAGLGTFNLTTGTGATVDTVTVNDTSATATTYTITSSALTRSGSTTINVGVGFDGMTVNAGGSGDTFNVNSLDAATALALNGNGGSDTFNVGNGDMGNILHAITITGGSGTGDLLILNDSSNAAGRSWGVNTSSNQITGSGMNAVSFDGTLESLRIDAGSGDDSFSVVPSAATAFTLNAASQSSADTVTVDLNGFTNTVFNDLAAGSAQLTNGSFSPITFSGVETFDAINGTFSIGIDTTLLGVGGNAGDDTITIGVDSTGTYLTRNVNGTDLLNLTMSQVQSLTVTGSTDNDTLVINEDAAGGLPSFTATAVGAHTNGAFTSSGLAPSTVGLQYTGGGGTDALEVNLANTHNVAYFSDTVGGAGNYNSGLVNIQGGFTLSFTGLAPLTVNGAGGTFTVDATSNNDVTTLHIHDNDDGVGVIAIDGMNVVDADAASFEDVLFGGFATLSVRSGNGADTIVVGDSLGGAGAGLDVNPNSTGPALTSVVISGENTTSTDNSADTFDIERLPSGIGLTINGGLGDDVINIAADDAVHSITGTKALSLIAGTVTVNGDAGTDTLNIVDNTGNNLSGTIDDTFVSGLSLGSQINYATVDKLNVTLGSGNDTVTIDGSGANAIDANPDTVLTTGTGNDNVTVNWNNFGTNSSIRVVEGNDTGDTLVVNGTTSASEEFNFRTAGGMDILERLSPSAQTLQYDGVRSLTLNALTGADTIFVSSTVGATAANPNLTSVYLSTPGGAIGDNNNFGADIIATNLKLEAFSGIGDASITDASGTLLSINATFDTQVANLDFTNTSSGLVGIANNLGVAAATLTLNNQALSSHGSATADGGSVETTISNNGSILFSQAYTFTGDVTVTATGAGSTITQSANSFNAVSADDVVLSAVGGIGSTAQYFKINGGTLNASTTSANAFITEADGLTGLSLNTGTADAHINLTTGSIAQAGGGTDAITAHALSLTGSGSFTLNDADGNDVDILAANLTGTGALTYINKPTGGTLTVDAVTNGATGISTTGATSITADNITVANTAAATDLSAVGITLTTTAGADGVITFNSGSVANAGSGAFTMTADEVTLTGGTDSIQGTGSLTIQPDEDTDAIHIGVAGGATDDLDLTDTELLALKEGFSGITIGRATGQHTIHIDSALFRDAVTIQSPAGGSITVDASTDGSAQYGISTRASTGGGAATITLLGDGDGAASPNSPLIFQINDDLLTTNAAIAVNLDGSNNGVTRFGPAGNTVTLDTVGSGSGANVTVEGYLSGTDTSHASTDQLEYLVVNAGTGSASLTGGQVAAQAQWQYGLVPQLSGSQVTIIGGDVYGNPVYIADDMLFPNEYGGPVLTPHLTAGAGVADLNIVFKTLTVSKNIGIGNTTADPTALLISQTDIDDISNGFTSITFGRNDGTGTIYINTTGSGVPITFLDPVFFRMAGTTGDIVLFDSANGAQTGGFLDSASLSVLDSTIDTSHIRDIDSETPGVAASFRDSTLLDAGITMKAGTSTISLAGRQETDGIGITYLTPVVLTGDSEFVTTGTIATGRGTSPNGATIRFASTLNGTTAGTEDAIFIAGTTGDLLFQSTVGNSIRIGNVLVSDDDAGTAVDPVNDIIASQNFTAKSFTQNNGTGNTSFLANLDTRGVNGGAFGGLGNGGVVDITTVGNVSISGTTDTQGGSAAPGTQGNPGGDVSILAANITVGPINTSGSGASTGNGGNAGSVLLDAGAPTDGPGVNTGGQITLGTSAGADITATGGAGNGGTVGNGGNVTLGDDHQAATEDAIVLNNASTTITTTGGATDGNVHIDGTTDGGNHALTLVMDTGSFDTEDTGDTFQNVSTFTITSGLNATFNAAVGGTDPLDTDNDGFINGTGNVGSIDVNLTGNLAFQRGAALTGQLRVRNAVNVTAANDQAIKAGSILQDAGSGTTSFTGTVETTAAGGINITANNITFGDGVAGADGTDAVTVRNAGPVVLTIDGSDTGTNTLIINNFAPFNLIGGGSFTQNGAGSNLSVVQVGDDITTAGGAITFRDHVQATQNITFSTGSAVAGNVLFDQNLFAATDGLETVAIVAGSGDVTVNGKVGFDETDSVSALGQLVVNTANNVTFNGDVLIKKDFTTANVIDSTNQANLINNSGFFVHNSGLLFFNGADLAVLESTAGVGGSNIVMQVGDAEFSGGDNTIGIQQAAGGNIGVLVIEPSTQGGNLNAGTGSGGVALSNNDVNALADGAVSVSGQAGNYGFSRIFLGRSDGTGSITLNNGVSFASPLYVRAPIDAGSPNIGNITIGGSGGVVLTGAGDPVVFDAHVINLGGNVTTNGGDIYFVSGGSGDTTGDFIPDPLNWFGTNVNGVSTADGLANVSMVGNSTVTSGGGDIYYENNIDGDGNPGDYNLTLNAGAGDIAVGYLDSGATKTVTGLVGSTDRLGAIQIVNAADVDFGGDGTVGHSNAGTGSVTATSFQQLAGTGHTILHGTTLYSGVETALRTGGFSNENGGLVDITTAGDFTTFGAIYTAGGTRSTNGTGFNGGPVSISASTIHVLRVDARGNDAVVNGDGGTGGTIALNVTDGNTITLGGDLLASGGNAAGGGTHGSASDVNVGDSSAPFTDAITLAPQNTGGHVATNDTITIAGNDVKFNGTVDGAVADTDSLFVFTFANFTQSPIYGNTIFNANVGATTRLNTLRTDTDGRTVAQANTAGDYRMGGFTIANPGADSINVSSEMTFNDGFVVANPTGVTLNSGDTVRFNNTVNSASGGNYDITIDAPVAIFDDNGTTGTGFNDVAFDNVDGKVGAANTIDNTLNSLGALVLSDVTGRTFINTTVMNGLSFQFRNPVILATSLASDGSTVVAQHGSTTITASDNDVIYAQTVLFNSTLSSTAGEFNNLYITTTGGGSGGTTLFNGVIGAGTDGLTGINDFTATSTAIGHLQTDTSGNSNGVTIYNTSLAQTFGSSVLHYDPVIIASPSLHIVEGNTTGTVTFNNTVNSEAGENNDLTVTTNGSAALVTTTFNGIVGGNDPLNLLRVNHMSTNPGGDTTQINANVYADTMDFQDNVLVGADILLSGEDATPGPAADATSVIFSGLVDSAAGGPFDLTINATTTQFVNNVGSSAPLGTVTTNVAGTTILGSNSDALADRTFTAEQFIFNDAVELQDNATVTGTITGDGTDTATLAIGFNSTVNSDAPGTPRNLTVVTTNGGLTRFGDGTGSDDVGGTNALGVLKADNYVAAPLTAGNGTTLINSGSIHADEITFNDKVAIGHNNAVAPITLDGTTVVRFNNTLDGYTVDGSNVNDLLINSPLTIFDDNGNSGSTFANGNDALDAVVGGTTPLRTLTTDAAGTTYINTTAMTGSAFQFLDPVVVATSAGHVANGGRTTITASDNDVLNTDTVLFNSTLDSFAGEFNDLLVITTGGGTTRFNGAIGATGGINNFANATSTALGRLQTDNTGVADGVTEYGPTVSIVQTKGSSIEHNDPVTIFGTLAITEGGPGYIHFNNTLDADVGGNAYLLTLNTLGGGETRFGDGIGDDDVGSLFAINAVRTDSFGTTLVNSTNFTVISEATFNDPVTIGINDQFTLPADATTITATDTTNGTIRFNNILNSTNDGGAPAVSLFHNLTLFGQFVVFGGNGNTGTGFNNGTGGVDAVVGGIDPLGHLIVNGPNAATSAGYINTSAMTANTITFSSAAVTAFGTTVAPHGTVTLTGLQTTGNDGVVFDRTLSSESNEFTNVVIDTPNGAATRFNGRVGAGISGAALGSDGTEIGDLTTDLAGTTYINTDYVETAGNTVFNDPVEVQVATNILNFLGDITFNNTLDSQINEENPVTFTLTGADGDLLFNGVVGDRDNDDDTTNTRLGVVSVLQVNDVTAEYLFKTGGYVQEGTGTVGGGTASGTGSTIFKGLVDTSGVSAGQDGGDIYIINVDAGSAYANTIEFRAGANLSGADNGAGNGGDSGDLMIRPAFDGTNFGTLYPVIGAPAGTVAPATLIVLGGQFDLLGGTGSVTDGLNGNMELAPDGYLLADSGIGVPVATFVGYRPSAGVGMDVTINTGTFLVGRVVDPADYATILPGKGTFLGDLTINALGSADALILGPDAALNHDFRTDIHSTISVMDMASVGDMIFTVDPADNIEMIRRPSGKVLAANGTLVDDIGLDFIAGGNTNWSATPIYRTGTVGNPPTFANPQATGNVSSTLETFPYRQYGADIQAQWPTIYVFNTTIVLDPSSTGPSNTNAAEALAAAIPKPEQSGNVLKETIVGTYQRQLLEQFAGVDVEGLTPAERLEFLTGRQLFNDLPGGERAVRTTIARALLTQDRLLYTPVADMLSFYRDFFLEEVVNPDTGKVELVSRHVEHRKAIASALQAYNGQVNAGFAPEAFAAFVSTNADQAQALRTLRGLRTLENKFQLIGLTPRETAEAMNAVLGLVVPEGMSIEQLAAVVHQVQPLGTGEAAPAPAPARD